MLSPLISTGILNAVFFGVYGNSIRIFSKCENMERADCDNPEFLKHVFYSGNNLRIDNYYVDYYIFGIGCIAGFAQVFISCPIEVIKTTLQSKTEGTEKTWKKHYVAPYEGLLSLAKGIYKERGIYGFYRGTIAMIYR